MVQADTMVQSIHLDSSVRMASRHPRLEPSVNPIAHRFAIVAFTLLSLAAFLSAAYAALSAYSSKADDPYAHMPAIAPIGQRIGKYLDVPRVARGPAIDPRKGYRLQPLGEGLYM